MSAGAGVSDARPHELIARQSRGPQHCGRPSPTTAAASETAVRVGGIFLICSSIILKL